MAAPYIIGIDPATSAGICEGIVGKTPTLLTQRFRGDTHEQMFGAATAFFAKFLKDRSPDLVAVEAPIMATWGKTNAQTTDLTRGLYAIFTGIAGAKGITVLPAHIGTWRKYSLGHGGLKGPEAKRQCVALCKQLGWPAPDHNAAEAAAIWLWAGSQIAPATVQRIEPLFARSAA